MCVYDTALSGTFAFCMFFVLCGALLLDMCTSDNVPDECRKTASLYGLSIVLITVGATPILIVLVSQAWFYMKCDGHQVHPEEDNP